MHGSALKIHRANEHILGLKKAFRKRQPFSYVLETNVETGERSTLVERHEPTIGYIAVIVGDIIHNLRSALDHAYWDRVGQFATTDTERKSVYFPFTEDSAILRKTVAKGLATRVSSAFVDAILSLEPHGESGGNWLLYAIHKMSNIDKHRLLIPLADFTRFSSEQLKRFVPDFPAGLSNIAISQGGKHVGWSINPRSETIRKLARSAKNGKHHQKIPIPVDVVFPVRSSRDLQPLIATLDRFSDVAQKAVKTVLNA
jgi:hypothetical protein